MSDEIFFDGKRYISANEAAVSADLTRDYIARLCRDGKISGRRVGKHWYVEQASIKDFLVTQEYAKSRRSESLADERVRQYHGTNGTTGNEFIKKPSPIQLTSTPTRSVPSVMDAPALVPTAAELSRVISSRADEIKNKMALAVAAQAHGGGAHAKDFFNAPGGFAHAALSAAHVPALSLSNVPVYALTPITEFFHKVVALALTLMLTFGTYAAVDPAYARFAAESVRENVNTALDSYRAATGGGLNEFANRAQTQVAAVAENPQAALASAQTAFTESIPNLAARFARALHSQVNDLVYAVAFPFELVGSRSTVSRNGEGSVSVEVAPYTPKNQRAIGAATSTVPRTTFARGAVTQTIVSNPVIERVVETTRLVSVGGITEEILDRKLAALDAKLSSQVFTSSAAQTTNVTNVYASAASVGRIEHLDALDLTNPTITNGSITGTSVSGSSVSATTLSSSGATSLATTTVTGDLTVSGAVNFTGTPLTATNATFTNATTTNATSTNLYATTFGAVTASTTNLTWVNATGTNSTSTNLYATWLVAGNATTTNFFSTNASTTNATSTNLFSVLSNFTTSVISTLTATIATITDLVATNLTATNATTTNATSTNSYISNLSAVTASTTNFTFVNATGTAATTTSLFSTTASSTNLFSTNGNIGVLSAGTLSLSGGLTSGGLATFTSGFLSNASSTITSGLFSMNGGASTTNLTASGTGYFSTATTTSLNVSGTTNFQSVAASSLLYNDASRNLAAATVGSSLTFSAGALSLNTGNGNSWTALQQFSNASTTLFSAYGPAYFGATATSSFSSTGVLTLVTDLAVSEGGTGASTLTGLLQGNGTSAFTAITDSSTVGQLLRVSGASTYAWGALDLADSDAVTGDLPFANLAQVAAASILGNPTGSTADARSVATSTLFGVGTPGYVLTFIDGQSSWVATTTLATITGTLAVAKGGTGATSFGQGWVYSDGGTTALAASTSPTVNYITATSTTATSSIATGGFAIGGSQFVVQQNSGRVGIGTASPSTGLDVGVATKISGDLTISGGSALTISASGPVNQTGTGQVTFAGNVDATNGLDVTNANFTVGGSNFTVAQGTGNTTIAGTLGLTGAFNASSTLQATGAARLYSTLQTDGTLTAAAAGTGLSVTNNASIGGTLALTGAGTFSSTLAVSGVLTAATSTFQGDVALSGKKITGVATPAADTDAANKTYVDSVAQGLSLKDSVRAGTTANITLSGEQTIDGVSLVVGNRVLVKDQTDQTKNGIYVVASGAWSRSTDADANSEVTSGMFTFITEGTLNANSGWVLTTTGAITLGTSLLTFTQFSGAGQITAGTGITKSGNTLDVIGTTNRITANADSIDIASTYVGQTSITTVGALTSGSLGSGFGNINIGASTITGGVATFSSIVGSAINGTGDLTISGSGTFSNALSVVGTLTAATTTFSGDVALGGKKITGLADPTSAQEAATKAYVDAIAQGLSVKASVRVATTSNITLSGTQTIDGVAAIAGDRVLVMGQSTASANGIYVVAAGAWSRSTDANENSEVVSGMYTFVTEGTAYANTGWSLITPNTITLDTTSLTFTQFSGSAETTAGDGLTKSGNTFNAVGTTNRISVTADAIDISSSYVGQSSLTTVGTLTSGSIGSGFSSINIGSSALTAGASIFQSATSYGTLSIGGTATTSIVGNSATSTFSGGISLAAGNVNVATGYGFFINNASVLNATTLGSSVLASSLTSVGGLDSGSITTGFGAINIGADTLDAGATVLASLTVSGNTTLANATSTTMFATTASSTNLYSTNGTVSALTAGTLNLTSTLNVTGLSTFRQASTTRLSVFDKAYFGGTATSTFDSAGNLFAVGTVGVGASSVDASAVFQIDSTTKGFLPPRMTTTQKNAIGSPAAGLTLYDSTLNKLNVYNGSAWKNVGSTEISGEVTSGTQGSVLFIGDGTVLAQDNSNFSFATSTNRLLTTQASTTRLSVFDKAYFGGTATSTFDSTGALTLVNALTYGGVTLSNAVTGTGNMVLSASPTFTGTLTAAAINASGAFTSTSGSANTLPYASSTALTVSGHCVTADTRLRRRRRRADGSYEYDEPEIVDIEEGDEIQSLDEKTGRLVWSRVRKLMFMGVKQTYRIVTEDGRTIRTTAEHPYLVKNAKGKWLKHRSAIAARQGLAAAGWATVANLREGDEIAVTSLENSGSEDRTPNLSRYSKSPVMTQRGVTMQGRPAVFGVSVSSSYLVAPERTHAAGLNNKTLASQRFWSVALKKFLGLADQRFARKVLDIHDNSTGDLSGIECTNIAEASVECEENKVVFAGVFKNLRVGSRGERHLARMNDFDAADEPQGLDSIAVDTLVRENLVHVLGVRDAGENLRRALKNAGGEFDGGINVLFGDALVLSRDLINGVAGANEIQNIGNSNTRPANRGFAESDTGVNGDALVHNATSVAQGAMKNQWSAAPSPSFADSSKTGAGRGAVYGERSRTEKAMHWAKILTIEAVAEEDVYDIEVEGTHNFVANGIVAHNTYLGNLLASASSTIGDGTQAGGLTVSGGATTTGNAYFAGNMGVGTNAPAHLLSVNSGASPTAAQVRLSANNAGSLDLVSYSADDQEILMDANYVGGVYVARHTAASRIAKAESLLRFDTKGSLTSGNSFSWDAAKMVIHTSGNVGIGTTTPGALLAVQGNALISNNLSLAGLTATGTISFNQAARTSGATPYLTLTGAADTGLTASTEAADIQFNLARTKTHANGTLSLQRDTLLNAATHAFTNWGAGLITDLATVGVTGAPLLGSNATSTNSHTLLLSASALNASTTNSYGLTVNANTGATNNYAAQFLGGNVGIGTSSPYAKLSVAGQVVGEYFTATSTTASSFAGGLTAYASSTIGAGTQAGGLTISGGATTTLNAYFGSKIGILNQAPTYALDVTGFINTDQYSGYKQAGNTILYASSTNTSVAVGGGAGTNFTTLAGAIQNTAIGHQALGGALTTDADYNSAFGYQALYANTSGSENTAFSRLALGSNTTGTANVAVGNAALTSNTTGGSNLAIGYSALYTATSSDNQTAVGYGALQNLISSTVSRFNTGVGFQALTDNTYGGNNTAIGYLAAGDNTTGTGNSALGYLAYRLGTTGIDNTAVGNGAMSTGIVTGTFNSAVGVSALTANTSGAQNSAFGRLALSANTTGSDNVAIGHVALQAATSSSNQIAIGSNALNALITTTGNDTEGNTAVGHNAGTLVTSGGKNTLLGYNAGNAITTGSQNIILGYDLDAPSATDSGQLNIGNLIFGTGLTGTGSTYSGNIGIGTTSPISLLALKSANPIVTLENTSTGSSGLSFTYDAAGGAERGVLQLTPSTGEMKLSAGATGVAGWYQAFYTTGLERMRITDTGNVGIGTSTPYAKLSIGGDVVVGAATAGGTLGDLYLPKLGTAAGTFIAVDAAGKIIATSTAAGSGTVTSVATNNGLTGGTITTSGTIGLAAIAANSVLANTTSGAAVPTALATSSLFTWTGTGDVARAISPTFSGTPVFSGGLINFSAIATSTIVNNSPFAFTIATSTTSGTLFRIDTTTGSERVVIGPANSDVIIGDVGAASNLIFEENSTIRGQGSGRTLTFGSGSDKINFGVNVGIGTTTPGSTLTVVGSGCFSVGATLSVACGSTAGNIYYTTANTGNYDIAENYVTSDPTVTPGTIVALDTATTSAKTITTAAGAAPILGIVSTAPGMVLGGADGSVQRERVRAVALTGRVPVKVNLEGGPIAIGDAIGLSSVPGVGTKATTTQFTVGIALENYPSATDSATVEVFVRPQLSLAGEEVQALSEVTAFASTDSTSSPQAGSFMEGFVRNLFARITTWLADAGNGIGSFFANSVRTKEVCLSDDSGASTCVTKAQLDALFAGQTASAASTGGTGGVSSPQPSSSAQGSGGTQSSGASAGTAGGDSSASATSTLDGSTGSTTLTASSSPQDTTAPVLTLNGANPATILTGETYADMGATATDNHDSVVYIYASVDGGPTIQPGDMVSLDTTEPGDHTVVFTVTDEAGNSATATRTVHVVMPEAAPVADPAPELASEPTLEPVPEPTPDPVVESVPGATSTTP